MDADPSASLASDRPDASREHAPDARGDAIGRLAGMLATFAAAGDLEGARAMLDAIGRLVGQTRSFHARGEVVNLEAERLRRAGR